MLDCNGRALDRVTKQKHRPNWQKFSKNVQQLCCQPPQTIFGHFSNIFSAFSDIFRTFCRHSLSLGCPTICSLQMLEKPAAIATVAVASVLAILRATPKHTRMRFLFAAGEAKHPAISFHNRMIAGPLAATVVTAILRSDFFASKAVNGQIVL